MRPASFQDFLVQLVVTLMIFMSSAIPTAMSGRRSSTRSCQHIAGEPPNKEATDIETVQQRNGVFSIRVGQDAYIETVMDVALEPERWSQQGPLTKAEVAACRTALGALQWLAIQTQPQLCARCNLLLTEVVTNGTIEAAREIQHMVSEVRADPHNLEFFKLPGTKKWTDERCCFHFHGRSVPLQSTSR